MGLFLQGRDGNVKEVDKNFLLAMAKKGDGPPYDPLSKNIQGFSEGAGRGGRGGGPGKRSVPIRPDKLSQVRDINNQLKITRDPILRGQLLESRGKIDPSGRLNYQLTKENIGPVLQGVRGPKAPTSRELYDRAKESQQARKAKVIADPPLSETVEQFNERQKSLAAKARMEDAERRGKSPFQEIHGGGVDEFELGPDRTVKNDLGAGHESVRVRDVGRIKDIDRGFAELIQNLNRSGLKTSFSHSALESDHTESTNPSSPHIGFLSSELTEDQRKAIVKVAGKYGLEIEDSDTNPPSLFVSGGKDLLGIISPDGKITDTFEGFTFDLVKELKTIGKTFDAPAPKPPAPSVAEAFGGIKSNKIDLELSNKRTITVDRNPSRDDVSRLFADQAKTLLQKESGILRFSFDPKTKQIYVWDANKAIHVDVSDALNISNESGGMIVKEGEDFRLIDNFNTDITDNFRDIPAFKSILKDIKKPKGE
jgi:hypothetical protein